MYQSLYNLISDLCFDGTLTIIQEEVVTWFSTLGVIAVCALPLVIIWKLVAGLVGSWR